jgi:hypothetical protein
VLSEQPASLQLRYLETLTVVGADKNSTIVFPLPIDLLAPFLETLSPGSRREDRAVPAAERGARPSQTH